MSELGNTTGGLSLYARLARVAAKVQPVGKTEKTGGGKGGMSYKYRSVDSLIDAVHPHLAAEQISIGPCKVESAQFGASAGLVVTYRVACPGEEALYQVAAIPSSTGALGMGAAFSYAFKYLIGQLFSIPFEADTDELQHRQHEQLQRLEIEGPAKRPEAVGGGGTPRPRTISHGTPVPPKGVATMPLDVDGSPNGELEGIAEQRVGPMRQSNPAPGGKPLLTESGKRILALLDEYWPVSARGGVNLSDYLDFKTLESLQWIHVIPFILEAKKTFEVYNNAK